MISSASEQNYILNHFIQLVAPITPPQLNFSLMTVGAKQPGWLTMWIISKNPISSSLTVTQKGLQRSPSTPEMCPIGHSSLLPLQGCGSPHLTSIVVKVSVFLPTEGGSLAYH